MQPAPAPESVAAAPRNVFSVLLDIFLDPKAAFRDILIAPRVWFPIIVLGLSGILFTSLFAQRVGWEAFMRKTFESNERAMSMPADQREQAIALQTKISSVAGYVMPPLFIVAGGAIVGAVMMFLFNSFMGAGLKFKQAFGIAVWAWFPTLLSTVAATLVLFLKSPEDFDLNNPVGLNVGFYMADSTPKWLSGLGSSLDIFSFWVMAVMAAGFSVASRKSWMSCFLLILFPWAVYVLLFKVGWNALFG